MANFETQGGAENYKGQYASLKFPKYKYQEYPKHVKDLGGKVLGVAENAMDEAELLANAGLEAQAIDPVAALQAELAAAKERLSKYEGKDPENQIAAKGTGKSTSTVEMLPAEAPSIQEQLTADNVGKTEGPVVVTSANKPAGNPLLKHKPGDPLPQGSAPQVTKQVSPGV